jgi:hypothetical protein
MGDLEPTLGEEFLHVAVAQVEAEIEPDRVLDNRRRKAVATIGEQGHAEMLSYPPLGLTRFRDDACRSHRLHPIQFELFAISRPVHGEKGNAG